MTRQLIPRLSRLFTLAVAMVACSSDPEPAKSPDGASGGAGAGGAQVCAVGSTQTCVGPAACKGGQMCTPQGTWGVCDCGSAGHGGTSGASGSGGASAGIGGGAGHGAGAGGVASGGAGHGGVAAGVGGGGSGGQPGVGGAAGHAGSKASGGNGGNGVGGLGGSGGAGLGGVSGSAGAGLGGMSGGAGMSSGGAGGSSMTDPCLPPIGGGTPGTLDTSFGTNGIAWADASGAHRVSAAGDAVVQSDGRIIVTGYADGGPDTGGDFALLRFCPDGSLDTTFGDAGRAPLVDFAHSGDQGLTVRLAGDAIVVAGTASGALAIVRYLSSGQPDLAFGNNGRVVGPKNTNDNLEIGLAVEPDGKIIFVGTSGTFSSLTVEIRRLLTTGELDPSFGTGGVVSGPPQPPPNAGAVYFSSAALDGKGRIVVVGGGLWILRLDSAGNPDPTFGGTGLVSIKTPSSLGTLRAVAVPSDEKIVVTGTQGSGLSAKAMIARFSEDGTPDITFGQGGITAGVTGGDNERLGRFVVDASGGFVASGLYAVGTGYVAFGARFTPDGLVDTSWGTGGWTELGLPPVGGVALTPSGASVFVGQAPPPTSFDQKGFGLTQLN